ncbi:MAG: DUF7546 family protein [Halovenus sp.]
MATSTIDQWRRKQDVPLQAILAFNVLFAAQLLAALVYGLVFEVPPRSLHLFLIPFLWITVSILAVYYTDPVDAPLQRKLIAGTVSGVFFAVFLYLSGSAGTATGLFEPVTGSSGVGLSFDQSLGWGPILFYAGEWVAMRVIPYQFVGYLALTYLIYTALLDVASSAKAGLLGLVLCPGCTVSLFPSVFASAAGISSAFAILVQYTYEISTVFFLFAVALMYWEPSLEQLRRNAFGNIHAITAGVAGFVAWLHLFHPGHGVFQLIEYVQYGTLYDPRPLAFTLAGIGMFAGILLGYAGIARKQLYVLGMGLTATFVLGYAAWHTVLHHGAFWPYIELHSHSDAGAIETVWAHLSGDTTAFVSKIAETTLFGLLLVLYREE